MKTASSVLDATALLAYLKREQGYKSMLAILSAASAGEGRLLINEMNLGEVYYITAREVSMAAARLFLDEILPQLPITVAHNTLDDVIKAAEIKARLKMPYVDAFTVATAFQENALLVTCDSDFKRVEKEVKVHWLR
ncbi:MAG: PIN domain-containing protein [Thermoleophilia bacterium]